ncbi:hypothetical protein PHLCEN_2v6463 [Hermanssonia centrifuga]|uniref:Peptidase C15, pyroglutamyl peptidase I-like protein n=1 Tax=Hermanssonia centrifuga TaxID=98765 RepID=A0A2R6NZ78_9APHY|nr:hypothetical protein PHLCEN_2v6463 [Hermanssonia centrifuga]
MAPVTIVEQSVGPPEPNAIRVLVTGFGPFWRYQVNPSWLAVKPLHNTILRVEPSTEPIVPSLHHAHNDHPMAMDDMEAVSQAPLVIHITTLQIPVAYHAVLSTVAGLHSRPPVLPEPEDPAFMIPTPPQNGYDFMFHIGVAGRGPLRIEKIGHKLGYRMKDAEGQYAPVVATPKEIQPEPTETERIELQRMYIGAGIIPVTDIGPPGPSGVLNGEHGDAPHPPVDVTEHQPNRGFGKGFENFADELPTEVDVARLIHSMKESGIESVYSSMDAGHYLCDFLFYGSLAEAKRVASKQEKDKARNTPPKTTPVLFMHCPPQGQPHHSEQVTHAIKHIIGWVCTRNTRP